MADPVVLKEWTLGFREGFDEENKKFLLVLGLLGEPGGCGRFQGRRLQVQYLEEEGEAASKQGA